MILRRRERQTLDALEDLVRFLGGVREERKAVITDYRWLAPLRSQPRIDSSDQRSDPDGADDGVDPRTGTLTSRRVIR